MDDIDVLLKDPRYYYDIMQEHFPNNIVDHVRQSMNSVRNQIKLNG